MKRCLALFIPRRRAALAQPPLLGELPPTPLARPPLGPRPDVVAVPVRPDPIDGGGVGELLRPLAGDAGYVAT